jgi:transposase
LAHRRIKASPAELEAALRGRVTRHHRFLLGLHLQQIDAIDAAINQIDPEVDALVEPFRTAVQLMTTIPGVNELSACVILTEIGRDMSRFPTAGHLISWAGLCPKNHESAGKRRSTRMRKGAPWLKTTLVQCAWAAARKKASYFQAQFHRLRSRRGAKKAIGALAASILTAVYHMLINERSITTSAPITSTAGSKPPKPAVSSLASKTSATPSKSPHWRHDCGFVSC